MGGLKSQLSSDLFASIFDRPAAVRSVRPSLSVNLAGFDGGLLSGRLPFFIAGNGWEFDGTGLKNSPTLGDELVVNGDMEDGDPPTGWIDGGGLATLAASATAFEGDQSLEITRGSANAGAEQNLTVDGNMLYLCSGAVQNIDLSTAARITILPDAGGFGINVDGLTGSWSTLSGCILSTDTTLNVFLQTIGLTGERGLWDAMSVRPISHGSAYALFKSISGADISTKMLAPLDTVNRTADLTGVVSHADSATDPQNCLLGVVSNDAGRNTRSFFLIKRISGVYNILVSGSVSWDYTGASAIEVRTMGTNQYGLFYGGVQIGTTQTVADVAGNEYYGLLHAGDSATFTQLDLSYPVIYDFSALPTGDLAAALPNFTVGAGWTVTNGSGAQSGAPILGPELLVGGDMEGAPVGDWTANGGATLGVETTTVYEGTQSLSVTRGSQFIVAFQDIDTGSGGFYRLQFACIANGADSNATWEFIPSPGSAYYPVGTGTIGTSSGVEWRHGAVFLPTGSTLRPRLEIISDPGDIGFFDDASIKKVENIENHYVLGKVPGRRSVKLELSSAYSVTPVLGDQTSLIAYADSETSPQNYLSASVFTVSFRSERQVVLQKRIDGVMTTLISSNITIFPDGSIEIRHEGADKFSLWGNGTQIGVTQTVTGIEDNEIHGFFNVGQHDYIEKFEVN